MRIRDIRTLIIVAAISLAAGHARIQAVAQESNSDLSEALAPQPDSLHRTVILRGKHPSASGAWTIEGSMPSPRGSFATAELNGLQYVIGGTSGRGPVATIEAYDPKTNLWTTKSPLPRPRFYHAAAVLNGLIYVIGGDDGSGPVADVAAYDPVKNTWTPKASLPAPRGYPAASVHNGMIYVFGGWGSDSSKVATVEAYNAKTNTWTYKASMPTARCCMSIGEDRGLIYLMGGQGATPSSTHVEVEAYDPETDKWALRAPMPDAREQHSMEKVGGLFYVMGGYHGTSLNTVESYDPTTGEWGRGMPMLSPRSQFGAFVAHGMIYAFGGSNNGSYPGGIEVYRPGAATLEKPQRPSSAPATTPGVASQAPPAAPMQLLKEEPATPRPALESDVDDVEGRHVRPHPDDFAIVIGLDAYRSLPPADYGERDAAAMRSYFTNVLGVPEENVVFLTGEKATRTDIAKYVEEWLPRNVTEHSRVYFYYSGHGAPDPVKGTAYLVPWDGDPEFLETSAYPLARLYEKLEGLKAREAVVMLDSCFSGAGGRSVIAKGVRPLVTVIDEPIAKTSKLSILTASKGDEIAGGLDNESHGLFTYYLLKGLKGEGDSRHLYLSDLHNYIQKNVQRAAHRQNREQTPQLQGSSAKMRLY
jgi:N-acetylneuraminic acid mutarotase